MPSLIKRVLRFLVLLVICLNQGCFLFQDIERDNPLDPKNEIKIVKDGLQHWWKLNGELSSSVGNLALYDNNIGFQIIEDRYRGHSQAISLNGTLNINDASFLNSTSSYILEFWAKLDSVSSFATLIDFGDENCGYKLQYQNGLFSLAYDILPSNFSAGHADPINTNNWQHLVFSVEMHQFETRIHLFGGENGKEGPKFFDFSGPFCMPNGMIDFGGPMVKIDDIRHYNRKLSEEEMLQNHYSAER